MDKLLKKNSTVKRLVVRKKINRDVVLDGDRKTVPLDTESRFAQLTMDTGCGQMCHVCRQYEEKLCHGCYYGCNDDIRDCTTLECDVETTGKEVQADGSIKYIKGPCGVRCCKRYNIDEWIDNVSDGKGSLSIQRVRYEPFAMPGIGLFIPSVNGLMEKTPVPYVSVPLVRLYSPRTDRLVDRTMHEIFNADPSTKFILNSYCQDPIIERFWQSYRKNGYLKRLKELGIDYSLGFNYSVYHGHPRMEHLINIHRNFSIIEDLQEAGIKVIPDLCWHNSADLEQFVKWINDQRVQSVSISLQLSRDVSIMARNMMDIDFLTKNCPNVRRWIVNGPSTPHRVMAMKARIPNMVLMSSRAFQLAKYFNVWDFGCNSWVKSVRKDGTMIGRREAFERNIKFFEDLMTGTGLERFGADYFSKKGTDSEEPEESI